MPTHKTAFKLMYADLKKGLSIMSRPKLFIATLNGSINNFTDDLEPEQRSKFKSIGRKFSIYVLFIVLLLLFRFYSSFALAPAAVVHDPQANAQLATNTANTAKTATAMQQQLTLLQKVNASLEKVNTGIRQLDLMDRIIDMNIRLIKKVQKDINHFQGSKQFSARELSNIIYRYNEILRMAERDVSMANTFMKDGFFKMNDRERIDMLMQIEKELRTTSSHINRLSYRVNAIIARKEFFGFFSRTRSHF